MDPKFDMINLTVSLFNDSIKMGVTKGVATSSLMFFVADSPLSDLNYPSIIWPAFDYPI